MRALLVGDDAVLVECVDAAQTRALHATALHRRDLLVRDLVPAGRTVLFDGVSDPARLAADVVGWSLRAEESRSAGDLVEVPTTYDGPDLARVAEAWSMTRDEVARTHRELDFVVAFCGFAPGFGYCTGLPDELAVSRRESPRPRVPTGSVGLAGEFTAVYPSASPGGWALIGRTELAVWDETRDPPALLAPGTRVRFVDA